MKLGAAIILPLLAVVVTLAVVDPRPPAETNDHRATSTATPAAVAVLRPTPTPYVVPNVYRPPVGPPTPTAGNAPPKLPKIPNLHLHRYLRCATSPLHCG